MQLALADQRDIENADVRVIRDAPLVFRGRVVSDGVLLDPRDQGERVTFETTTRMRYLDYLPIHQERFRAPQDYQPRACQRENT